MVRDCCRHRDHAIVEQVIAELKDGPLAHAPSGKFTANAAWLTLACLSFNVLRAAGAPASTRHARARCGHPAHPPHLPARPDRDQRPRITLHLPRDWPWQPAWQDLWATATHP
jgi:hypothetical protein